jgi:hypothetical protein
MVRTDWTINPMVSSRYFVVVANAFVAPLCLLPLLALVAIIVHYSYKIMVL